MVLEDDCDGGRSWASWFPERDSGGDGEAWSSSGLAMCSPPRDCERLKSPFIMADKQVVEERAKGGCGGRVCVRVVERGSAMRRCPSRSPVAQGGIRAESGVSRRWEAFEGGRAARPLGGVAGGCRGRSQTCGWASSSRLRLALLHAQHHASDIVISTAQSQPSGSPVVARPLLTVCASRASLPPRCTAPNGRCSIWQGQRRLWDVSTAP
jgi:hypothetical protein